MRVFPFCLSLALLFAPLSALAYTPNDTLFTSQGYLRRIAAPEAWDITRGAPEIIVAVVDSGVDISHPDLASRIWTNEREIPGNGIDDDADGYVDDVHGWDFVAQTNDPQPDLANGWLPGGATHGTVVSGLLAATADNAQGISGVAPQVRIMPLRIVDAFGRGNSPNVVPAIRYAVDHGARIINMSLSGAEVDPEFNAEIIRAYRLGVVIVAAAGNTHDNGGDLAVHPVYPVCLRDGEAKPVLGVAALDTHNMRASFSNFGGGCIDISAPGTDMLSTMLLRPEKADFTAAYGDGWNGTSFAAPLISGAAALLLSLHPNFTPDQVRTVLQLSADPVTESPGGSLGDTGAGRLNVARALQIAGSFDGQAPASAPVAMVTAVVPTLPSQGLSPVTGLLEDVTPVSAGEYIRSASFPTVYAVTPDLHRRPFFDVTTFFTYADSFAQVKTVTDATLATLSLGSPMLPKPGVVLVKIQSDPQTYVLGDAGADGKPVLRLIPDEATAIRAFGPAWSDFVIDVPPTLWRWFAPGVPVNAAETMLTDLMKKRTSLHGT